jgi:peroxiredoxin Q/BCP
MPVELRKRPAPAAVAPPPAKKAAPAKSKPAAKEAPAPKAAAAKSVAPKAAAAAPKPAAESTKSKAPSVGDSITLEGFGGEVSTQDGETTTLAKLVADSKAGVVLFTYPAANTPGCKLVKELLHIQRVTIWRASHRA